jgi:CheY-like chemotaxis protein
MSRILLVDDCPELTGSLSVLLGLWGHEVRCAHDGLTALSLVDEFQPQVVLLDLFMPGMTGYEVAGRLRSMPAGQGVLLVAWTALVGDDAHRRAGEAGFHLYLPKPVWPDDLRCLLA